MNGANTVRVMLGAIWPSFLTLKNQIPESQGIDTNTMISFALFWLIQLPFLYMHPNSLRWLFMVKSVIVPIAWVAILIWAFVATDGGEIFDQKATLEGSAYSWAFLSSLTSVIGNYATLSVNQVRIISRPLVLRHGLLIYVNRPIFPATLASRLSGNSSTSPFFPSSSRSSPSSASPLPPLAPSAMGLCNGIPWRSSLTGAPAHAASSQPSASPSPR